MLLFFLSLGRSWEGNKDSIWSRHKFEVDSDNHALFSSNGIFKFDNIDKINIIFDTVSKPLHKNIFSTKGSFISFHSNSTDKVEYEIWNIPQKSCRGLNYWIDFHYGMKIQMNKVKQDKEICLFMPSDYFVSVKINTSSDDISAIYRSGKEKSINVEEINDLSGIAIQPFIIVIPPSESRTIDLEFVAIDENAEFYCHAKAIEEYGFNEEDIYKYDMPFDYSCFEEEEGRLLKILYASIVAAISGSILFTINYFPYFCPKKAEPDNE